MFPGRLGHLLVFAVFCVMDSVSAWADTVNERNFDQQKIEQHRNSKDYRYEERIPFSIFDWLERIGNLINEWLRGIFDFDMIPIPDNLNFVKIIIRTAAILALAAVIYIIFKGKWSWLFSGRKFRKKDENEYLVFSEDIHAIPFESEIDKAIQNKNYRLATRLFYLKSLKELSDNGYIEWRINKTNSDYKLEISASDIREEFAYLSVAFEYIWYGELQPGETLFWETFSRFRNFSRRLQKLPSGS